MPVGSPKTIVYVCNSASSGGANRSLSAILAGLDRNRFRPLVVIPKDGPFSDRLRSLDIPTFILPMSSTVRFYGTLSASLKGATKRGLNFLRFLQLLENHSAALVHTNTIFPLAGALGAKLANLPHVWHVREGLDLPLYQLRFGCGGTRALMASLSDRLICISEYVRRVSVSRSGDEKSVVIPNALEAIPPARAPEVGTRPMIGCVGVISTQKRTRTFIDVAAHVSRALPRARFLVAGRPTSGEEGLLRECRNEVHRLGLDDRFRWPGVISDLDSLYSGIDLVVHTGVHEGFGRVIMEAMARGIPVVSVASGAIPELVKDGETGRVVEPDNVEALAAAVLDCLGNPAVYRRLSRTARTVALQQYDPALHARRVMAIYEQLLSFGSLAT